MKPTQSEASPMKALLEDIEVFRHLFHGTLDGLRSRMDADLEVIRSRVSALGPAEQLPTARLRDLRDMLTLIRSIEIRPEKGRRKDLKKLDSVAGDLTMLSENW